MGDNTLLGVGGIVAIVIVTALFLGLSGTSSISQENTAKGNIAGAAYTPTSTSATDNSCEPGRFCDGSKLVIVRSDCSLATAFCQSGCNKQALTCN